MDRECPFQCGWWAEKIGDEDDAWAARRIHLEVEHGANAERDEEAWEDFMASDPRDDLPPFTFDEEAS